MNKSSVTKIFKNVKTAMNHHSPEILTGLGIAGMVTTVVMAVKATPKALESIEEKKKEVYDELDPIDVPSQALPEDVKLKPAEVVKVTWKHYIPATVTGVASIACIIGASRVNLKRNAALVTAYNLSQTALTEYKEKVVETIGEKKEQKVREAIAKDRYEKYSNEQISKPESARQKIHHTDGGDDRMFDVLGQREFTGSKLAVDQALVRLNNKLRREMTVSLNDFYDEVGLPRLPVLGDSMGWYVNKCDEIELCCDTSLNDDGKAVISVDFLIRPDYDYNNYR